MGLIALLLLTGGHPFEVPISRRCDQAAIDFSLLELLTEQGISEDGRDFVHRCLRVQPDHRLGDREAIRHPWFNKSAEDVKMFERCDREALGGWEPRRHICPMIEDLATDEISRGLATRPRRSPRHRSARRQFQGAIICAH